MKNTILILGFLLSFLFTNNAEASFPVKKVKNETETVMTKKADVKSNANNSEVSSGKSQIVALLLCWAVGIIGIHRFYLGYTWQGIVQILTLGGLGFWTLIDFIRIIIGSLKPKNGSYSKTL